MVVVLGLLFLVFLFFLVWVMFVWYLFLLVVLLKFGLRWLFFLVLVASVGSLLFARAGLFWPI